MKKLLLLILTGFLFACSASKRIEKSLNVGNYDAAISDAIDKLRSNKDRKGNQDIIVLLSNAYTKATERDLNNINFLKQDSNPENYLKIYDAYNTLRNRQERIKPLTPLYVNGKEVKFKFNNYTNDIISFKNKASEQMYTNAKTLLKSSNKLDYRLAYNNLNDIEAINPNYKDVRQLMDIAHEKGTDFVLVNMINDTQKVIPVRLENDLLNFSAYGLNNFWAEYHSTNNTNVKYDYTMQVNLRDINVSPEQIKEREVIKEKQVVDGWKYLLDDKGNAVKDSLGNKIKVDKLVSVRCEYYEITQFKASQVTGNVEYFNINTNQLIDAFPISSEFIFEHIYATSRGDRRALEDKLLPFLERRAVPFPTEEQMIYDTGEDLKLKLKEIMSSYNF